MPKEITAAQATAVSTNASVQHLWSRLLEEGEDTLTGAWVDPLTLDMELLRNVSSLTPVQYVENTRITTLSYNLYGTTSLWAVLLYLNGYMHPDEIPPGATLLVPSLSDINDIMKKGSDLSSPIGKTFKV